MNTLESRRGSSRLNAIVLITLALTMFAFFSIALLRSNSGDTSLTTVSLPALIVAFGVAAVGIYVVKRNTMTLTAAFSLAIVYPPLCYFAFEDAVLFSRTSLIALTSLQSLLMAAMYLRLNHLRGNWGAAFALSMLTMYALLAILAPLIAQYGETEIVGAEFEPWSLTFPLGTDNLGRDMLTRIIYGARNTISIALTATILGFAVGTIFGQIAAAFGGWLDDFLSRIVDVIMAIPQLILALLVLTIAGTSLASLVAVIAVVDATRVFRLVRAITLKVLAQDFVEAARARGEGYVWILSREALPNITAPLAAEFGVRFCFTFLFISSLSFLGVGVQPPTADWGSMIRENAALIAYGDITPLIPALAIAMLAISVNLIIDYLLNARASR